MNKICTSIKQSQRLVELGIDVNTADMCYGIDDDTLKYNDSPWLIPYYKYTIKEHYIPCWSLAALLNMIDSQSGLCKDYDLWICYDNRKSHITKHYENAIDAVFEMIVWLKENKKI